MKKIVLVIAFSIGFIITLLAISLFSTFLWYCFDDRLAELTNIPELGTLPWYNVWPFTLFISSLFKGVQSCSSKS